MQVFKLFFQVLRKYMWNIIMYMSIFMSLCLGFLVPQLVQQDEEGGYTASKCDFAVFDYDNSDLSKALVEYLAAEHNLETIADDTLETMQDELYALNVDCILLLQEGFEAAFAEGISEAYFEIYSVPGSLGEVILGQHVNSYLSVADTYVTAGFSVAEAAEKSAEAAKISVEVEMYQQTGVVASGEHYFFKYLSWVFCSMCISSLSVVLCVLDKKEVRERISCSSYKFSRINLETLLAVAVTGFVICAVCVGIGSAMFADAMAREGAVFYVLNAFCIMAVALACTFMVSKISSNPQVISLMANVIGLGMAFLCGVFVPLEFMSESVIKIAHFLPAYWNVRAIQTVDTFTEAAVPELLSYMGIQLLFAVAIACVGLLVARNKQVARG